jgi:tetratricopeptide (TPR) repeat protein
MTTAPDDRAAEIRLETLTRLNRLAGEEAEARRWLAAALRTGLPRLAEAAIEVAVESGQPIGNCLAGAFTGPVEPGLLFSVFERCHHPDYRQAVSLREVSLVVTARVRAVVVDIPEPKGRDERLAAAALHDLFGVRAFENGVPSAAIDASRQAVDLLDGLHGERPDDRSCARRLAGALLNLGNHLGATGRFPEALRVTRRSERLLRELGDADGADAPTLAMSLETVSYLLARHQQLDEAVSAAEEAARLHTRRGTRGRDRAELALGLHNLALRLRDKGLHEQALDTMERSLALLRELFHDRAEELRADLASCQLNRGLMLHSVDEHRKAEESLREAVGLYRILAGQQPGPFEADLALALQNHGVVLADLGRTGEAITALEEAVALHRSAVGAESREALVAALNSLGSQLAQMERFAEGEERFAEAVEIREELSSEAPEAHREALGTNLSNHAAALFHLGRSKEARAEAARAVRLLKPGAERAPHRYGHDLAIALHTLANASHDLGAHAKALDTMNESITIRRRLLGERGAAEKPGLARALIAQAMILVALDRRGEAADACREAHDLLVRGDGPAADAELLTVVDCTLNLGEFLLDQDLASEAGEWLDRAGQRLGELLAREGPWYVLPALERLSDLAELWDRAERPEDAKLASEIAVDRCRHLAAHDPEAPGLRLAYLLYELGVRLANTDATCVALARLAEAMHELIAHHSRTTSQDDLVTWRELAEEVTGLSQRIAEDAGVARDEDVERRLLELLAAL